jgi:hypothetical protein
VPRPKPSAKTHHATEREEYKLRQVRQSAEHLADRRNPALTSPTRAWWQEGGRGGSLELLRWERIRRRGLGYSGLGAVGMSSRRHRRRGGSRGEPGLITNQLDSREGVNARKKILLRERPLPRTRIQSLNFALTRGSGPCVGY